MQSTLQSTVLTGAKHLLQCLEGVLRDPGFVNTILAVTRDLLNLWPVIRDSHRQNSVKMKPVSIHTHIFVLFYSGDLSKTFTTAWHVIMCHFIRG